MKKFKNKSVFLFVAISTLSPLAWANGVVSGQDVAAKISSALDHDTVTCTSDADRITLEVDKNGDLQMIASYNDGTQNQRLNTDNEGYGEECGGLSAKENAQYSDFILDDSYNDCERGDFGYRILFSEDTLRVLAEGYGHFTAQAYVRIADGNYGAARKLDCSVR